MYQQRSTELSNTEKQLHINQHTQLSTHTGCSLLNYVKRFVYIVVSLPVGYTSQCYPALSAVGAFTLVLVSL